jgi:anaerobic selenocysteine-containing dehydrogenase
VTAAAANRAHAAHAFVAGPLFKESATAIVAATFGIKFEPKVYESVVKNELRTLHSETFNNCIQCSTRYQWKPAVSLYHR